ncbi:MAG: patatin-like phospholipase family protein [Polyangiaceae bacterium]
MGLVLSGGGARGAYQVGALRAIAEILPAARRLPFAVLAGASAGSITNAFLAADAHDFPGAVRRLAAFWGTITPHDVFRTDARTLARVAVGWATDLALGGWIGGGGGRSLLVTEPLRETLEDRLDVSAIHENIEQGLLRGIALTTTNYRTNLAVTFFDGAKDIAPWGRSTRVGIRQQLTVDHVMASSAIPIFFPAVRIAGKYYADGCVRLTTPLSPAVHLGADRILAIGVRPDTRPNATEAVPASDSEPYPTTAETAGMLMNSLFLESLESDIERLERVNHTVSLIPPVALREEPAPIRPLPLLVLRPSRDIGEVARGAIERYPYLIRHLFRGLGATDKIGADLVSYLAFDAAYTSALLSMGYEDTLARRDELASFLSGGSDRSASPTLAAPTPTRP